MKVTKRINNNAVLCIDGNGKQVIALGSGLARTSVGDELDLDLIERTFYNVDQRYIDLMRDLPVAYLNLAASIADAARSLLTYELSPNLDIALADHLDFAVKRAREGIVLQAPLAYDIRQNYPVEYKIAQYAIAQIRQTMGVALPPREAAGIALSIINGAYTTGATPIDEQERKEQALSDITELIEQRMGVHVDRDGFGFARFATHVQYLLDRVLSGESIDTENSEAYALLAQDNPKASTCVDAISDLISTAYDKELTGEEKLYLILHVNRICQRSHP